ncbi:type II toxin-antitoxin system RelE/ParE family toxin [Haemophilus haemolyticus]|uniref:type II toxin-antitoxin system RelE/ParE family toxin n=1 Tax=Haemophilus haemolyticus TaxID=726 RepID=UPI000E597DDC|nr:type II toxin-antitoxin system RelE/ParE family toxin [Haemophilus haemolyticus]
MAKQLQVLPAAEEDLEAIFAYGVESFGFDRAFAFLEKFQRAFSLLCEFDLGSVFDDFSIDIELRRYVVEGYVIFFKRTSDFITIVRVLHGSQDVETQFS